MLKEFFNFFPFVLAGMALGCMLTSVLYRHSARIRVRLESSPASRPSSGGERSDMQ